MDDAAEMNAVIHALLHYLRRNPLACDTAEGISRWWLANDSISTETLLQALDLLKQRGIVEELVAADGRARIRRSASLDALQAAIEAHDGRMQGPR